MQLLKSMEKNMNNVKRLGAILFAGVALLVGSALAKADSISIVLSPDYQIGGGGDTLEFDATVTNLTAATVWLNSDSYNVDAPLTLDDTAYFNNFPLSLAPAGQPGDVATGWLFTVDVWSGTPVGLYGGNFGIVGGDIDDFSDVIGSADFTVQITPEPPAWQLTGMALLALCVITVRRRAFSRP